jgi:hypothetical protein
MGISHGSAIKRGSGEFIGLVNEYTKKNFLPRIIINKNNYSLLNDFISSFILNPCLHEFVCFAYLFFLVY